MDRQREPQHRRTVREDGNLTSVHIAHPITKEHTVSVYDHPDYFSFVNAIRERPDDDLPRLVCSDWLEEQGEEADAGIIRLMLSDKKITCMKTLGVPGFPDEDTVLATYIRGFVESIHLPAADWVKHADAILKRNPIRKVTLTGASWYGDGLFYDTDANASGSAFFDAGGSQIINLSQNMFAMWPGIVFTFERANYGKEYQDVLRANAERHGGITEGYAAMTRRIREQIAGVHIAHPYW